MILGTGCLGSAALDGPAIRGALGASGLSRVLLAARDDARAAGLAGVPAEGVRCEWSRAAQGAALAAGVRAPRLVLDLPPLPLERACRELHACARRHADLLLAVTTPAEGPLAEPDAAATLLADLAAQRVGYWHVPSRAHLLGHGDAPWLDALARQLCGMSLDDVAQGRPGALPGLGGMDLKVAAAGAAPSLPVALDVGPLEDLALLRFAVEHLRQAGFRN